MFPKRTILKLFIWGLLRSYSNYINRLFSKELSALEKPGLKNLQIGKVQLHGVTGIVLKECSFCCSPDISVDIGRIVITFCPRKVFSGLFAASIRIRVSGAKVYQKKDKKKGQKKMQDSGRKACFSIDEKYLLNVLQKSLYFIFHNRINMEIDAIECNTSAGFLFFCKFYLSQSSLVATISFHKGLLFLDCVINQNGHCCYTRNFYYHPSYGCPFFSDGSFAFSEIKSIDTLTLRFEFKLGNVLIESGQKEKDFINIGDIEGEGDLITGTQRILKTESNFLVGGIPVDFKVDNVVEAGLVKLIFGFRLDDTVKDLICHLFPDTFRFTGFKGGITFYTVFSFSFTNPFNYKIDCSVYDNNLRIDSLRNVKNIFHSEKNDFLLKKDGCYIRKLVLGDKNENYLKLANIPDRLVKMVLLCEDPNFFSHCGIDISFVGRAMIENLLYRRFQRGASTITMQLVRNLFLHKQKTLPRKFQEIIISLFIENILKINKEKILEIYLNIIEFAPNIYGLQEGAKYYFGKKVESLNPWECLALTYIIPRPSFFNEALLLKSRQLSVNLGKHFERFLPVLERKNLLPFQYRNEFPKSIAFANGFGEIKISYK